MRLIRSFAMILALGAAGGAMAQQGFTKGVVQKVKPANGQVTIQHEQMSSLDMPAMTTVFRTANPALLKQLSPGKSIEFTAARVGGKLTVTAVK